MSHPHEPNRHTGGIAMIKNQIKGSASQMIVCQLDQGQTMYCDAGKFL
jgi:hypothetical protein